MPKKTEPNPREEMTEKTAIPLGHHASEQVARLLLDPPEPTKDLVEAIAARRWLIKN